MAAHWREGHGFLIHCEGVSHDYMLCGAAPEGADGDGKMFETFEGITCDQCIRLIEFCRSVRPGEIEAPFKRRGRR